VFSIALCKHAIGDHDILAAVVILSKLVNIVYPVHSGMTLVHLED
jgi:hypothetical protein